MSNVPPVVDPSSPAAETDPFLSLHKMSTTAGLGSADYVAINGIAIATILLGIGSAVTLFQNNLLLLIPLAALVCGVLAFIQITNSNGTQTGKALAAAGIAMALGFGGYVVSKQVYNATANHAEQNQVMDLIAKFSDDIKSDNYEAAYGLTSSDFQTKIPLSTFTERFKSLSAVPLLGHISKIEWNEHMEFDVDPVSGQRIASTYVKLTYAKAPQPERSPMVFQEGDKGWAIVAIPELIAPEQAAAGAATPRNSGTAGPVQPAGPPAPK